MIAYKVIFGPITKTSREDAEWIVEDYISSLFHNRQVCGENFLIVQDGLMCSYIHLQGINANLKEYHCKYGIERLKRVIEFFSCEPSWECIDDVPEQNTHWKNEDTPLCPSCGQNWSTGLNSSEFHHFAFQCDQCRLVSHLAVSYEDERHAVIGEWRGFKIK